MVGAQLAKLAIAAFEDYTHELRDASDQIAEAVREQLADHRTKLEE